MSNKIRGFFAYPSLPPRIPELIGKSVKQINKASSECQIKTWEDCSISGKIIIDVICREIESHDFFLADLTGANPNVLFELGYAIGKRKRVWVLLDTSIEDSKSLFDKLCILTTVGYSQYSNSENIVEEFFKHSPWRDLKDTIFKMSIEPTLGSHEDRHLLYLKHHIETEASRELSRIIEKFKIPMVLNDPYEASVQTLGWYASKIWQSIGVIAHLSGRSRIGSQLHNSRYAFVSGLAHGFDKPLLMLAESDYQTPIDYKDILHLYSKASDCMKVTQEWLEKISEKYEDIKKEDRQYARKFALEANLRNINLGDYLAENEEQTLEKYFIETQPFSRIIAGQNSIIVGRKGSGKTANLYMAASRLREDKRNLVCVIKPVSYDVQGVVRLSKQIRERDNKGYLSESLWKFLVSSDK